jgi:hypothetical protein
MHQTPHTTSLIKFERIFASGVIRVTHTHAHATAFPGNAAEMLECLITLFLTRDFRLSQRCFEVQIFRDV